jgi:hypothetical protein
MKDEHFWIIHNRGKSAGTIQQHIEWISIRQSQPVTLDIAERFRFIDRNWQEGASFTILASKAVAAIPFAAHLKSKGTLGKK